MACRFHYQGQEYDEAGFRSLLKGMEPSEAAKYIPEVKSVPSAPFVTSTEGWTNLALKRILRYASENGYDRVAWTTGDMQAARYDLSKQVGELAFWKVDADTTGLSALDPRGSVITTIDQLEVPNKKLPDVVGKEVADQILGGGGNAEPSLYRTTEPGVRYLSGENLRVGGEGMRGFYDQIIPQSLNKLGKKWGARVGETEIETPSAGKLSEQGFSDWLRGAAETQLESGDVGASYLLKQLSRHSWTGDDVLVALHNMRSENLARYGVTDESFSIARQLLEQRVADQGRATSAVHSLDITPQMRASVMEGQPLFRAQEGAPAGPKITAATVKRAFAAGDVREVGEGAWDVSLPGDRQVRVRIRPDGIEYDRAAFEAGYGRQKSAGEEVVGSWQKVDRDAIITLAKRADEGVLTHEVFHDAMGFALSPKERAAVLKRYGNEEAAAEAYAKWEPGKQTNGYFAKILNFFRNLYRTFRPTWESAFERTRSGEAYGKRLQPHATAGRDVSGAKYATAPSQPPQVPPQKPKLTAVEKPTEKPLGRPMRPGEAPRVETKVEQLREVAPTARLSRDAPRTWESLDPAIKAKLNDVLASAEKEQSFYEKVRSGKVNDVEIQAMDAIRAGKREAYLTAGEKLKKARAAGRDTGPENIAYLEAALDDLASDYAKAARSDVEAGTKLARALAARARVMNAADVSAPDKFLSRVFREIEGITDEQAKGLVRVLQEDPDNLSDALNQAMRPKALSKWLEAWKAGLVSAPGTQIANIAGNVGEQAFRVGETAVAALVDSLLGNRRTLVRREGTTVLPGRTRFVGEAGAEVRGAFSRLGSAMHKLSRDLRDIATLSPEKIDLKLPLERQVGAIGGKTGRGVRIPFRLLGAFDNFFKAVGGDAELYKLAYRKAGGNREKAAQIVKEALDFENPQHLDLLEQVARSRQERTFQAEPGPLMKGLMQLRANQPWLHVVMPFLQTPANIASLTIQRSPFGFFAAGKAYKKFLAAQKAGASAEDLARLRGQAVEAIAKPLLGTAMMGAFAAYAKAGGMTGSGPTDDRQRNLLRDSGWQPYSFVVKGPDGKNLYIPFHRFEPVSSLLGFAADMAESQNEKKSGDLFDKVLGSVATNLTNKTYLQSLADAVEFLHRPQEAGSRYVSSLAGSLVPNIIAKGAQAIDPTLRDTRSAATGLPGLPERLAKTVGARLPGVSQTLPERRSGTGELIERPGSAFSRFASPVQVTADKPGRDLERLLVDIDAVPSAPTRDLTIPGGKGRKVRLTEEEYDVLQAADKAVTDRLRKVVNSPAFKRLDPEKQRNYVRRQYEEARAAARRRIYRMPAFRRRQSAA